MVEDGYEFFAKRQLVTLFSAPNYCGEFDNAGAMMSVDETLMCSFQVRTISTMSLSRSTLAHQHSSKIKLFFFFLMLIFAQFVVFVSTLQILKPADKKLFYGGGGGMGSGRPVTPPRKAKK